MFLPRTSRPRPPCPLAVPGVRTCLLSHLQTSPLGPVGLSVCLSLLLRSAPASTPMGRSYGVLVKGLLLAEGGPSRLLLALMGAFWTSSSPPFFKPAGQDVAGSWPSCLSLPAGTRRVPPCPAQAVLLCWPGLPHAPVLPQPSSCWDRGCSPPCLGFRLVWGLNSPWSPAWSQPPSSTGRCVWGATASLSLRRGAA